MKYFALFLIIFITYSSMYNMGPARRLSMDQSNTPSPEKTRFQNALKRVRASICTTPTIMPSKPTEDVAPMPEFILTEKQDPDSHESSLRREELSVSSQPDDQRSISAHEKFLKSVSIIKENYRFPVTPKTTHDSPESTVINSTPLQEKSSPKEPNYVEIQTTKKTPNEKQLFFKVLLMSTTTAIATSAITTAICIRHNTASQEFAQKRFLTGLEFPLAAKAISSLGDSAVKVVGGFAFLMAIRTGFKEFNAWLHTGCKAERELIEEKFNHKVNQQEQRLKQKYNEDKAELCKITAEQHATLTEELKREILKHRQETRTTLQSVAAALEHAGEILANIPDNPATDATLTRPEDRAHEVADLFSQAADRIATDIATEEQRILQFSQPPEKTKCGSLCC